MLFSTVTAFEHLTVVFSSITDEQTLFKMFKCGNKIRKSYKLNPTYSVHFLSKFFLASS